MKQKRILLGITGSIAAYKSAEIVRLLTKAGHQVKVLMTKNATEFIGAATFRALTNESVAIEQFEDPDAAIHHISLARDYDLFLIAPASANVIAKIAQGVADDLLTTTAVASTAPLFIAPAMNVEMYLDEATQLNLTTLKKRGVEIIEPEAGFLACGDIGKGRMSSPEEIMMRISSELSIIEDLRGLKVAINAGPTRESLDPVRYLSNHSSGKMGYALAQQAKKRGAGVTLISGPVCIEAPFGITYIPVTTAEEMYGASLEAARSADIFIASAAVSDYRLAEVASQKIKRSEEKLFLELVPNKDIIEGIAKDPSITAYTVAFAAESENLLVNARKKREGKKVDMVAANDISNPLIGFNSADNELTLILSDKEISLGFASKNELARKLLDEVVKDMRKAQNEA